MSDTAGVISAAETKMKKAIASLQHELQTIRTGRANPGMLDRISVEYYGTPTPLKQLAQIAVPDARSLTIQPFDRSVMGAIEKALLKSDLGLTPNNDGTVIRLIIPPMTEERRKDLGKVVKKTGEEAKVVVRNARRDLLDSIKKQEKEGLSSDESKRLQDQLQKLTDRFIADIDKIAAQKEAEILEK